MTSKLDFTIMDTGPCLNFMGTGNTDVLLGVLESISATVMVPEDVADEVKHKSEEIPVFTRAASALQGAQRRDRITIAPSRAGRDDVLDRWVSKLFGMPRAKVKYRAKDLGEKMAVAHAAALQEQGRKVFVVVNDSRGKKLADAHGLDHFGTLTVLRKAAMLGLISDRQEMKPIYNKIQPLEHALRPITHATVQAHLFDQSLRYGSQGGRLVTATGAAVATTR